MTHHDHIQPSLFAPAALAEPRRGLMAPAETADHGTQERS